MKTLFLSLMIFAITAMFTGCGLVKPVPYKKVSFSRNIDTDMYKVDQTAAVVSDLTLTLGRKPTSQTGGWTTLAVPTGKMNAGIAKEFLKQYFKKVVVNPKNLDSGIVLKSKILDFEYNYGYHDDTEMTIKIHVTAYNNGKLLFSKDYTETKDNYIIMNVATLGGLYGTYVDAAKELFHKLLFDIYESQVKKDLLKSLK